MKFGVMLPHYRHVASAEAITRLATEAEAMGYDSAWVTDLIILSPEYSDRFGPVFYESLTVLAFVAGFTSRIRLGSSVIVLPYRNHVHLAKVVSSIDSLSHGRLMLGVGVGGAETEFRQLGVPWDDRGDRTDEAMRIFKELWTSENPSIQTKNYQISDIDFYPKPVQKPHLPIWVGGSSRRALRRVVEFGDVWHPVRLDLDLLAERKSQLWKMAERSGRDPQEIGIAMREPVKLVSDASLVSDEFRLLGTVKKVIDNVAVLRDAGVGYLVLDTFYLGLPRSN